MKKDYGKIIIDKLNDKKISADVNLSIGDGVSVTFKDDKVVSLKSSKSETLALRLINGGKIGLAGSNKLDETEIDRVVNDAIDVSNFGQKALFKLPAQKISGRSPITFDKRLKFISASDLVDIGKKVAAQILRHKTRMKIESLDIDIANGSSQFLNTNGVNITDESTVLSFSIEISKISEGDFFQLFTGQSSVSDDIDFEKETQSLLTFAQWGNKIAKIKSGKYPVILAPQALQVVLDPILRGLNGKHVNEGVSKLKRSLGSKMFDNGLSIFDDPTIDNFLGSKLADDEGVASKKIDLVKNGVVKNFYYDLQQAAKADVMSTGSGFKGGLFSGVTPGISNLIVGQGNETFEKLLKSINEGVLGYYFLGAGQNNPFNGDFQLSIFQGYKIEKGEVVGRLKDTAISGNSYDLLRDSLMWISQERMRLDNTLTPYVCLDNVVVTSR